MASATVEKFEHLKKQAADIQKQIKVAAKAAFKEMSEAVFEDNPSLVSFSWTQYTPWWNDGEPCVFDANAEYPTIVFKTDDGRLIKNDENCGDIGYLDEDGDIADTLSEDNAQKFEKQIDKLGKQIAKFLSNFNNDDFLTMFGDHVEVLVKRNGKIEVEGYDHD